MTTGSPHVERLKKDFAGIPAGARLLISSPLELDAYLRQQIRPGTTRSIQEIRRDLAQAHAADATCPMTTSIFLRIVAENAWDQLQAGADIGEIAPFWRAVEPTSPLARKLRAGPDWIANQRESEVEPGTG
jgi:hypothetical protein